MKKITFIYVLLVLAPIVFARSNKIDHGTEKKRIEAAKTPAI